MPDVIESQEFTCPECGSHAFGTAVMNGLEKGHCHGNKSAGQPTSRHGTVSVQPCRFTWDRKNDALYFKGTGRFHPRVQTAQYIRR